MPPPLKRPSAASGSLDPSVSRTLVQCGTKAGLVAALRALHQAGQLDLPGSDRTIRRRLQDGQAAHAMQSTPYGSVLQKVPLPLAKLPQWEICHPLAYISHLSSISASFAKLMVESSTPGIPMRLILYIDEICPGNPLRPEKSRTLQAVYWAFVDWPQHVLQRTALWPCLGTIRSSLCAELPGGVSQLMKLILKVFWPTTGPSFEKGVTIENSAIGTHIVTARFHGFLCDEKAHNQVFGSKGASGNFLICLVAHIVHPQVPNPK